MIFRRKLSGTAAHGLASAAVFESGVASDFASGLDSDFGSGLVWGAGWNGSSARVARSRIALRSASLNLSADVNRLTRSAGMIRDRLLQRLLRFDHFVDWHLVEKARGQSK